MTKKLEVKCPRCTRKVKVKFGKSRVVQRVCQNCGSKLEVEKGKEIAVIL